MPGLRKGRTAAREPEPIGPVSDATVKATLPYLPTVVADMVRIIYMELRQRRKSKVQPSQVDRRKRRPKRQPSDRYDKDSYRRAIARAVMLANRLAARCLSPFSSPLRPSAPSAVKSLPSSLRSPGEVQRQAPGHFLR